MMNEQVRHEMVETFVHNWFENPQDMDCPDAYPRALCSHQMLTMALGQLVEEAVVESHRTTSAPLVDLETICRMCVGDV